MSYHEDDELNRLHEFMREEAEEITDGEVLDYIYSTVEDDQLPDHEKLGYVRQLLQHYRTGGI
jgi:hypothetical protein